MDSQEYLMLRDEILHLDNIINNTTTLFYGFIAGYLVFVIPQNDTIYMILIYIVILPTYLIVLNKAEAMYKISAYLIVFHEEKRDCAFRWETRNVNFLNANTSPKPLSLDWIQSHMRAYHFPFFFVSFATAFLFIEGTCDNCKNIFSFYESGKIFAFSFLFFITCALIFGRKHLTTKNYIKRWEDIQESEPIFGPRRPTT